MKNIFGDRVKSARQKAKLSQSDLASAMGLTQSQISKIEKGESDTSQENVKKLATILNVAVSYLMGETNNPDPNILKNIEPVQPQNEVQPILTEGWLEIPLLDSAYSACAGGGNGLYDIEATAKGNVVVAREWIDGNIEPYKPFGVRVEGDSMEQAGIPDGAIAIINPNVSVDNGDIAFFSVNGAWMVKGVLWKSDGGIELIPANPSYQKLSFDKDELESGWIKIVGKVVYSLQAKKPKRFL